MRFGICLPGDFKLKKSNAVDMSDKLRALLDGTQYIKEVGYDYIEWAVFNLMGMTDDQIALAAEYHKQGVISVESCNCFMPFDMPLVGDSVDTDAIRSYLEKAIGRMAAVGVKTVVFGSGGARRIPDGYSKEKALGQLDEFLILAEGIARNADITVVIEPLNSRETNVFLTVTEAAKTVRRLNLPNLKLLADFYHTYAEGESPDVLSDNIDILHHIHVAQPESRRAPKKHPYLKQCGDALKEAGYNGRISIESHPVDFTRDMIKSLPVMKKLF